MKIRNELNEIIMTWTDGLTVGEVFLRHVSHSDFMLHSDLFWFELFGMLLCF